MNSYKLEKNMAMFKGTEIPMLQVVDSKNNTVFKMPIRWQLVFAMTSHDKLWFLEETPQGTFSVEADLLSGFAKSHKMDGTKLIAGKKFHYTSQNGEDLWEVVE